ncbi:MAG: DUF1543 domain-containing protein [Bdellovibrionales bacterium]
MTQQNLFAVYVGGTVPGANVELHDMRFVVSDTMENAYDELRAQWWGEPKSLHLDAWGNLEHADGHDITLKAEPSTGPDKLWFANLGGYNFNEFTELHANLFIVAPDLPHARQRALEQVRHWDTSHRDYIHEVENLVCIDEAVKAKGLHIHLTPAEAKPFTFSCGYVKIGVAAEKAA